MSVMTFFKTKHVQSNVFKIYSILHRWLIIHYNECSALVYLFLSGKGMASNKSISLLLAPVTLLFV